MLSDVVFYLRLDRAITEALAQVMPRVRARLEAEERAPAIPVDGLPDE